MAAASLAANRSSLAWGRVVKVGVASADAAVALNAGVAATRQPAASVLAQQLGGAFAPGGASVGGGSQAPQPVPVQPPPASSFMSPALARSLMRQKAEGAAAAAKAAEKKRPAAAQRSKEAESSADDEEVEDEGGAAWGSGTSSKEGRWQLKPEPRPAWITVTQFNSMNVKERREAVLARDDPFRDELILAIIIFVARQANAGVGGSSHVSCLLLATSIAGLLVAPYPHGVHQWQGRRPLQQVHRAARQQVCANNAAGASANEEGEEGRRRQRRGGYGGFGLVGGR